MDGDRNPYLNPHFRRLLESPTAPEFEDEEDKTVRVNATMVHRTLRPIGRWERYRRMVFFNSHDPFQIDKANRFYREHPGVPREWWDLDYVRAQERLRAERERERQQRKKQKK